MSRILLSLIAQKAIEDNFVDWLMMNKTISGFTSFDVYGHSDPTDDMTALEKVRGKTNNLQIQIHMEENELEGFLAEVKAEFGNTGIHYFTRPVIDAGHL